MSYDKLFEDAVKLMEEWKRYAYHSSGVKHLDSIRTHGLRPNNTGKYNYDEFADNSKGQLHLSIDPNAAMGWTNAVQDSPPVTLRTPVEKVPPAVYDKVYGSDEIKFHPDKVGESGRKNIKTEHPVPPENLEFYHGDVGGWVPLTFLKSGDVGKLNKNALDLKSQARTIRNSDPDGTERDFYATKEGQLSLFPKELFKESTDRVVNEIVESLLNEVTFLRAYKQGALSRDQIKTAAAMRTKAGEVKGRKVPVLSADMGPRKWSDTISHSVNIYPPERWEDHKDKSYLDVKGQPGERLSNAEKLRKKYYDTGVSHTVVNIDTFSRQKEMIPVLGHELGHMVDAQQDNMVSRSKESEGRLSLNSADNYVRRQEARGRRTTLKPSKAEKLVVKNEGRAWRYGKALHDEVKERTPESEKTWRDAMQRSLTSYTYPYAKR